MTDKYQNRFELIKNMSFFEMVEFLKENCALLLVLKTTSGWSKDGDNCRITEWLEENK